jgi:hypothetical protein
MTDPKRWIDDGAPDPVRELLLAAREEQPRPAVTRRTLVALGLGGALSAGAESAAGAAGGAGVSIAAAKGASIGLAVKWGLLGAVTAAVLGIAGASLRPAGSVAPAAHVSSGGPRVVERSPAVPRPAPAVGGESEGAVVSRPSLPAEGEPSVAASARPAAVSSAPGKAAARAPERSDPTSAVAVSRGAALEEPRAPSGADGLVVHEDTPAMLEEVASIDRARAAVARGDAAAAIGALDAYAARFKAPRFEPEALYLRMEALGRAGDRDGARRAAERLLAAFPNAPQSARARALFR